MKQLPLNIVISAILLGFVFFVAYQGLPNANASTIAMPGVMVDGISNGHLRLHGFGFRPGSLVNLELRQREGGHVVSGVNAWVDSEGKFAADFDTSTIGSEVVSFDGNSSVNWNDWMVLATASTGSFAVPVRPGETIQ